MRDCDADLRAYDRAAVALSAAALRDLRIRRNRTRLLIKRRLAASGFPQPIGFYGQGSVAMGTIVRDPEEGYDIDDGVYFRPRAFTGPNGGEMSGYAARQLILEAAYAERFWDPPEMLKNCVRVYYAQGFHIDTPVYRVTPRALASPLIELASSSWKLSDPRAVTRWFRLANRRSPGVSANRQLVRIVRYMKAWVRARSAWHGRILGGFGITALAVACYQRAAGRDDRALYETLRAIQALLHAGALIPHPVLQGEWICPPPNDAKVRYLRDQLDGALARLAPVSGILSWDATLAHWNQFFRTDFFEGRPQRHRRPQFKLL